MLYTMPSYLLPVGAAIVVGGALVSYHWGKTDLMNYFKKFVPINKPAPQDVKDENIEEISLKSKSQIGAAFSNNITAEVDDSNIGFGKPGDANTTELFNTTFQKAVELLNKGENDVAMRHLVICISVCNKPQEALFGMKMIMPTDIYELLVKTLQQYDVELPDELR